MTALNSADAKWDLGSLARRVAADIPDGSYVNLGIGMPTAVADLVAPEREIVFHSENGILGVGPKPPEGEENFDIINAGKECVTLLPGSAIMAHCDSFALIRGGHLDLAIMGAFQVSQHGDLANWTTGVDAIPAVGGAMDLAVGAREVWVMMRLMTADGKAKIVSDCTFPLTASKVVRRIYTDMGVFGVGSDGLAIEDMPEGVTLEDIVSATRLPFIN